MRLTAVTALAVGVAVFGAVTLGGVRAEAVDCCSLLSPDKVAAAFGVPEIKTPGGPIDVSGCEVYAPGAKSVTLQLMNEKGFAAQRARSTSCRSRALEIRPCRARGYPCRR